MKTTPFLENCRHRFAQCLFPQMFTVFKGITSIKILSYSSNIVHLQESYYKNYIFSLGL